MKLKSLHIANYKIFKGFEIDFCIDNSPADIIVIAGVNGTGKTTLLKEVIKGPWDGFQNAQARIVITNQENQDGLAFSVNQFSMFSDDSHMIYLPASVVKTDNLAASIIKYVDKQIYEENKTSAEAYVEVQRMIDLIFKDFDLNTRFFGMNRDKDLIFTNLQNERFGINGLSAGEKQILGKVFPLFINEMRDKVILMDEPEESLHPSWQINLVPVLRRCAKENNCQFILATHSPQIISSVKAEELRLLVRDENSNIRSITCSEGPYGWTIERVLSEIQRVNYFRVPEVEVKLEKLRKMIGRNEYDTDSFKVLWTEMEALLGYPDKDLVLMRMEILRRRKKNEEN
jgi:Predicted ATPase